MIAECFFEDRESLFTALVEDCKNTLEQSLNQNGSATLMVSGGSSPMPVYQRLSKEPLAWSDVHVALVDERWVNNDHPASNEAFIKQHLLQHNAPQLSLRIWYCSLLDSM